MIKPELNTVPEFYRPYIKQLPDISLSDLLTSGLDRFNEILTGVDDDMGLYRYQNDKWSIKEVIQHLIDSERIFAYRILRFAREDTTDLPGFDQDIYVSNSDADNRTMKHLVSELNTVRKSSCDLILGLSHDQLQNIGTANGYEFSANVIAFILAGHLIHHLNILQDRYLPNFE